jgi:hypothetical protein
MFDHSKKTQILQEAQVTGSKAGKGLTEKRAREYGL